MRALPEHFDPVREYIVFVFLNDDMDDCLPVISSEELRYVRLSRPHNTPRNDRTHNDWNDSVAMRLDEEAPKRWRERYGQSLSADRFDYCPADVLAAATIPYDGPTRLTQSEQQILYCGKFGDLTLAMLYVMIEGFGWRPGAWHSTRVWPARKALLEAWRYWEGEDPKVSLEIALSVYAAKEDGICAMGDEILNLAADIDREARGLPVQPRARVSCPKGAL